MLIHACICAYRHLHTYISVCMFRCILVKIHSCALTRINKSCHGMSNMSQQVAQVIWQAWHEMKCMTWYDDMQEKSCHVIHVIICILCQVRSCHMTLHVMACHASDQYTYQVMLYYVMLWCQSCPNVQKKSWHALLWYAHACKFMSTSKLFVLRFFTMIIVSWVDLVPNECMIYKWKWTVWL